MSDRKSIPMPPNHYQAVPNLVEFVSMENQQFLTSVLNFRQEMELIAHLQGLYAAGMDKQTSGSRSAVIFQMLSLVHYHFLFSTSSYMRCHMAEAFSSARVAVDSALIAALIIHDRDSQTAYVERKKPFDKLIRYYKNLIEHKKPLPHHAIRYLVAKHGTFSQFASHADVETFMERLNFLDAPRDETLMAFHYLQIPTDEPSKRFFLIEVLSVFAVILKVFADFLVDEHKSMPDKWRVELHNLGRHLMQLQKEIGKTIPDEVKATASGTPADSA